MRTLTTLLLVGCWGQPAVVCPADQAACAQDFAERGCRHACEEWVKVDAPAALTFLCAQTTTSLDGETNALFDVPVDVDAIAAAGSVIEEHCSPGQVRYFTYRIFIEKRYGGIK